MNQRSSFLAPLLVGLLGAACAPSPVKVDFNFPTTAALDHSEQGRLRVFQVTPDQLGACPELIDQLRTSFSTAYPLVFDSQLINSCSLVGDLALPEFGEGPHAYLVEMRNASNELILAGCRVAEVYAGAPNIRIELHPTDQYPTGAAPASRCGGVR